MSDFLDGLEITEEAVNGPSFIILYGPPKVGKSWLCRHAEKPFYIAVEKGVEKISGVGKFTKDGEIYMPKDTEEFFSMLRKFTKPGHDYKTIVLDSGMFLDKLFTETILVENPKVKKGDSYIDAKSLQCYNFGEGYGKLLSIYEIRFFTALKYLHKRGLDVVLIAHSREKTVRDTQGDEFKKHSIDMAEFGRLSVPSLLSAKADAILFMQSEVHTKKKQNAFGAAKTVADTNQNPDVVVYTRETSAFYAGVRTEIMTNVKDSYVIDFGDDETSKNLWRDLKK